MGRQAELVRITDTLVGVAGDRAPVVVVSGSAGVGKTALAVHAAHRVAEQFVDGQLFADLRGHSAAVPPSVAEVLGQLLRTLGMPPESVPLRLEDQTLAFRSLLAGRRVLLVLDDAVGVEQVRALLPGSAGCAVLVTSRYELAGLSVSPGAQAVGLAMLAPADARALLAAVVGADRVDAQEQAAAELVQLCGGLALAVRVAGAHLAMRPLLELGEYVEQLRAEDPVAALQVEGDERANLSAAFDWSYRLLAPHQQRLLRLLSLVPGPDLAPPTAAALIDVAEPVASAGLEELATASLIERGPRSRYRLHDLIRAYASRRCGTEESERGRQDARRRLFDHYVRTTDAHLQPLITLNRLSRPAPPPLTVTPEVALTRLDGEREAMVAAVRDAADQGPHDAAYHLADALRGYFTLRGHTVDWLTTVEAGLVAAVRTGHDEAVAAMLNNRGGLRYYVGDSPRAAEDFAAALEIYERLGSPAAHGARVNLGIIAQLSGDLETAVKNQEAAMIAYRQLGEENLEQVARSNLVLALIEFGDLGQAKQENAPLAEAGDSPKTYRWLSLTAKLAKYTGNLRRAATLLEEAAGQAAQNGDHRTELATLGVLASCYLELGRPEDAHRIAEATLADHDDPRNVASLEIAMAGALSELGRPADAAPRYRRALRIARESRHRGQECGALIGLAAHDLDAGAIETATSRATEAVAIARDASLRLQLVEALVVLAGCHHRGGGRDRAGNIAEEALTIARRCEYPLGQALALHELGEIRFTAGDTSGAAEAWRHAERIYTEIGSRRAARTAGRLAAVEARRRR